MSIYRRCKWITKQVKCIISFSYLFYVFEVIRAVDWSISLFVEKRNIVGYEHSPACTPINQVSVQESKSKWIISVYILKLPEYTVHTAFGFSWKSLICPHNSHTISRLARINKVILYYDIHCSWELTRGRILRNFLHGHGLMIFIFAQSKLGHK